MNEQQMVALVERVGETLEPDVARLVAVGTARGRARRARRRLATAFGAASVTVAVAVLVPLLASGGRPGLPGPAAGPQEEPRRLAVMPGEMGATLETLLPGSHVIQDGAPYQFQVQRGVVRWRGVTVTLAIDTRGVGASATARERCDAFAADRYCAPAPRGAWVHAGGTVALDPDTGDLGTFVNDIRVYVPGGYLVDASADGRSAATREVLRAIALDDVWWS